MKIVMISVLIACLLAGCAGSPMELSSRPPEKLQQVEVSDLAVAYGVNQGRSIRTELERRGVFTSDEWSQIDQKKFGVGATRCHVLAAWGYPSSVQTEQDASGETRVYEYRFKSSRVTMRNDRVVTIRSW